MHLIFTATDKIDKWLANYVSVTNSKQAIQVLEFRGLSFEQIAIVFEDLQRRPQIRYAIDLELDIQGITPTSITAASSNNTFVPFSNYAVNSRIGRIIFPKFSTIAFSNIPIECAVSLLNSLLQPLNSNQTPTLSELYFNNVTQNTNTILEPRAINLSNLTVSHTSGAITAYILQRYPATRKLCLIDNSVLLNGEVIITSPIVKIQFSDLKELRQYRNLEYVRELTLQVTTPFSGSPSAYFETLQRLYERLVNIILLQNLKLINFVDFHAYEAVKIFTDRWMGSTNFELAVMKPRLVNPDMNISLENVQERHFRYSYMLTLPTPDSSTKRAAEDAPVGDEQRQKRFVPS